MTQNLVGKAISNAKSSRNQKLSKNNFQALSANRRVQGTKLLTDKALCCQTISQRSQLSRDASVDHRILGRARTKDIPHALRPRAAQIRPGEDGLILQDGPNRGTFLPSVWESLPDPVQFLTHLKHKAGLAANHWSDRVEVYRYRTESFGEEDLA